MSDLPRALIVEDDPAWRGLLGEILADLGLAVDYAGGFGEAAALLRQHSHRVAVLDLSLGGSDHNNQDGLRVAQEVRRRDPNCALLFLTGFATVELAVQVMQQYGALTCLRKEVFRRAEFRRVIEEALARPPAPPEAEDRPAPESADGGSTAGPAAPAALVVEDDAGWRELIGEILTDAGLEVTACASYVQALGALRRIEPRLAVVDLSLASSLPTSPRGDTQDGYRLLGVLRKAGAPVIVVSGYAEPERIEAAYRDGLIHACLEKQSFERRAFRAALESALQGGGGKAEALAALTEREREVLALLAEGLTNKEIARAMTITQNTVKRHLKSLFVKLDVNTRAAASARAIQLGLGKQ